MTPTPKKTVRLTPEQRAEREALLNKAALVDAVEQVVFAVRALERALIRLAK